MSLRRWLVSLLLTLVLTGFVLVQARLRTGLPASHSLWPGLTALRGLNHVRQCPSDVAPWRESRPRHWRACMLQQGCGCQCRMDSLRVP
jgi:hypothetical protein